MVTPQIVVLDGARVESTKRADHDSQQGLWSVIGGRHVPGAEERMAAPPGFLPAMVSAHPRWSRWNSAGQPPGFRRSVDAFELQIPDTMPDALAVFLDLGHRTPVRTGNDGADSGLVPVPGRGAHHLQHLLG